MDHLISLCLIPLVNVVVCRNVSEKIDQPCVHTLQLIQYIVQYYQQVYKAGVVPEGGKGGYSSVLGNLSPPVREKIDNLSGNNTDYNTFIYCTNYEYLLQI